MKTLDHKAIAKLLVSPVARAAAALVSFEKLEFGTKDERVAAWGGVMTVCLHAQTDAELNRWWRLVTPDAAWNTAADLHKFSQWKVCDIRGTK